jgi:hypothetical protein
MSLFHKQNSSYSLMTNKQMSILQKKYQWNIRKFKFWQFSLFLIWLVNTICPNDLYFDACTTRKIDLKGLNYKISRIWRVYRIFILHPIDCSKTLWCYFQRFPSSNSLDAASSVSCVRLDGNPCSANQVLSWKSVQ